MIFKNKKIIKSFFSNYNKLNSLIKEKVNPNYLEIIDNSASHGEPTDSHFNVLIVSNIFEGMTHIKRHKLIFDYLKQENLMNEIHAVSLITKTENEYNKN